MNFTPAVRPTTAQVMMAFAELLASRSTCGRLQVGAVVTDLRMLSVLAIGYNGGARGAYNGCDNPRAEGRCGCLHAEVNALLKAPGATPKVLFVTHSPCKMCAKAIINSDVMRVYYYREYRDQGALAKLRLAGIEVEQLDSVLATLGQQLTP